MGVALPEFPMLTPEVFYLYHSNFPMISPPPPISHINTLLKQVLVITYTIAAINTKIVKIVSLHAKLHHINNIHIFFIICLYGASAVSR